MTIFEAIKQHRAKSRVSKQREVVQLAAERLANARANSHYAKHMLLFYKHELASINHEVDYWRYAELKQKEADTSEELTRCEELVAERIAQLDALQTQEKK